MISICLCDIFIYMYIYMSLCYRDTCFLGTLFGVFMKCLDRFTLPMSRTPLLSEIYLSESDESLRLPYGIINCHVCTALPFRVCLTIL